MPSNNMNYRDHWLYVPPSAVYIPVDPKERVKYVQNCNMHANSMGRASKKVIRKCS